MAESRSNLGATVATAASSHPSPQQSDASAQGNLLILLHKLFIQPFWGPLLRKFRPYDRGDFRWEFLTPWLDRDMSRLEKGIVFTSFVYLALSLQLWFDPDASYTDHLSQIALFFGYAMGNRVGYRLIAIAAAMFEIFAHSFETQNVSVANDAIPVFYNVLFVIINLYYVMRWQLSKQIISFGPSEEALFTSCFEPLGLTRQVFSKLLEGAEWHKVEQDQTEVVFLEGEPLRDFYVAVSGSMELVKSGVPVTMLQPYQIIGEAALLENLDIEDGGDDFLARGTVVAEAGAQYVSFSQSYFYRLMQEDTEFAYAAQLMISKTLSRKLGKAREEQQQMSDYVMLLASEAERAAERREFLATGERLEA